METVTIKIDKKVKKEAQKQARQQGVSLSRLFSSKITTFFKPQTDDYGPEEKFNAKTAREMRQIMKDIKDGKNLEGPFSSVEEFMKALK